MTNFTHLIYLIMLVAVVALTLTGRRGWGLSAAWLALCLFTIALRWEDSLMVAIFTVYSVYGWQWLRRDWKKTHP